LTAIDKDGNGYLDTIYFGNVGGHLFKTDISDYDTANWATHILYRQHITDKFTPTDIDGVAGDVVTVASKTGWNIGDTVTQFNPYASGYITDIDNKDLTIVTNTGTFQKDKKLTVRTYDGIYHEPAVTYDTCYQRWVAFGTGDRDRPRTNPYNGKFIGFKDGGSNSILHINEGYSDDAEPTNIQQLNAQLWGVNDSETVTNPLGWYFDFPDTAEKMFDPSPLVIPDENLVPHILFNTYQPPATFVAKGDSPCDMPQEGIMTIYDIALISCGTLDAIEGTKQAGRLAGGGGYHGEIVTYVSETGKVADVPGEEGSQFPAKAYSIDLVGSIIFWLETKR